jgi:hypothetical protein
MSKRDAVTLGDIYGGMLRKVKVVEEASDLNANENIAKSKKNPKMPENAFTNKNKLQKGGPQEKGGYHKALNDCQDCNNEEDEETYPGQYSKHDNSPSLKKSLDDIRKGEKKNKKRPKFNPSKLKKPKEDKIVGESQKIARKRLNTFMSKKSTFDKLFESVMGGSFDQDENQEVDALGLGDAPTDDEFGSDEFGGDDDQVTFTLDRATAQKLHEVLMGVLDGGEGDFEDEGEDLDFGDDDLDSEFDEDSEEDMDFQEDEERGVHPTDKVGNDGTVGTKDGKGGGQQHKLQQKGNKVNGKPQPKGSTTKVVGTTDKVGNDGDYGHAISSGKQPDMGKQNKVSDIRQAEDFFR